MQHKMGMCEGMHITPTHNIKDDEAIQKKKFKCLWSDTSISSDNYRREYEDIFI